MRCLDLFCGAGGASMGYHRAGYELVGVDIVDQPNYPFTFVRADALAPPFELPSFDMIHASPPPCEHDRLTEKKYWPGYRPDGKPTLSSVVQVYGHGGGREHWADALDTPWMTPDEMTQSIPPAYTEWIGQRLTEARPRMTED